ncbi:dioxygenase [Deefgea piscis]|uniref:Dioxygenase n=1 Tax=Deefgea piscis TaxID=2739061 RepID=A0A6M8SME8_9NEIS|nr:class III extradiol ring-cleavage dioxygenase [Deefgea piscis]QKJ65841.1 dioxygenase [Deefgea piscis]
MPRSLFISHGAPSLAIEPSLAHDFLISLGQSWPRPKAIVLISAHNIQAQFTVGSAQQWQEVHDFSGFSSELYQLQYRPQGDPGLAERLALQLANDGHAMAISEHPAIDHGAWVPLMLMYPKADIPLVTISLAASMDSAAHLALGQSLAKYLPDEVLLIGSGSITHNLNDAFSRMRTGQTEYQIEPYAAQFIAATYSALNTQPLLDWVNWQQNLPHARQAHPTIEHFLPLLIARAAAGDQVDVQALHQSMSLGVLGMDVIGFTSSAR